MKKILISIILLLLSLVIIDRSAFYLFRHCIAEKNFSGDTGGSINYLIQKKKTVDFIVLGSSRAKYHIDPALLTNAYGGNGFNAGLNGVGGIIYNDMLLQLLISKNITPKMVILQTDPLTYIDSKNENFNYELTPLFPYLDDNDTLNSFVYAHAGYNEKIKLFFKTYRYNGKFAGICYNYLKRSSVKENNGFEGLRGKIDTAAFKPAVRSESSLSFSATKIAALHQVVQTCRSAGITLLVVFAPTYNNNGYSKQINDKLIGELKGTTVYDLSDINNIPALQSPEVWKDGSHLNYKGAAIFSRLLNDSIAIRNN